LDWELRFADLQETSKWEMADEAIQAMMRTSYCSDNDRGGANYETGRKSYCAIPLYGGCFQ
jgi:hypothetical protein